MRVLHVIRQFTPSIGGLETYLTALLREQGKLGHECEVLTLNKVFHGPATPLPPLEIINKVKIHRIGFWGHKRLFLPFLNPNQLKEFDIIHVHNTDVLFDFIAATRFLHKRPIVCTTHGGFFHTEYLSGLKGLYFATITKWSAKAYNCFFACSENDEKLFRKISNQIILLQNAVDTIGQYICDGPDFVYVGRLSENKRLENLLRTHAELIKRGNIRHLHIIGPDNDVSSASLDRLVNQLETHDHVTLHGYLKKAPMEDILKKCGFFVSASSFEGFGMTMIETMSIGLLPLVQKNQSFVDLQSQSSVGKLIDFEDHKKAAADIDDYLGNHHASDRKLAQTFASKFDWTALAQKLDACYEKIVDGKNPVMDSQTNPNLPNQMQAVKQQTSKV